MEEKTVINKIWLNEKYKTLHKCFMSEKGCTFERDISSRIKKKRSMNHDRLRKDPNAVILKAFVIMPFSPFMDQIFQFQIRPFLSNITPKFAVSRADTIMRTGYVMCEKICKQIQESDLIVAEITQKNVNVLYEIGMSAGLGKKILLLAQKSADGLISSDSKKLLDRLEIQESEYSAQYLSYIPFTYLQSTGDDLEKAIWKTDKLGHSIKRENHPKIGVITGCRTVYGRKETSIVFRSEERMQGKNGGRITKDIYIAPSKEKDNALLASTALDALDQNQNYELAHILECVLGSVTRDIVLNRLEAGTQKDLEEYLENSADGEDRQAKQERRKGEADFSTEKFNKRNGILRELDAYIRQYQGKHNVSDENLQRNENVRKQREHPNPYFPWQTIQSKRSDLVSFFELINFIEQCECLVIDTTPDAEPINFFWLGYAHAKGKHVIPVNVYSQKEENTGLTNSTPFDVRGLWLVYFDVDRPDTLRTQFEGILDKIIKDAVDKKARRKFWEPFLSDIELRIVVGANLKREPARYMVGEWDYLTLAELVSFLSQEKPTLNIQIESPVYHPNRKIENTDNDTYNNYLKSLIEGRNCILIASPDVNVATEMVFSKAKNVSPFQEQIADEEGAFCGYVAFKNERGNTRGFIYFKHGSSHFFESDYNFQGYHASILNENENKSNSSEDERDMTEHTFYISNKELLDRLRNNNSDCNNVQHVKTSGEYLENSSSIEGLYGHMALFNNPYSPEKKILVLSGISGPATMAMAQILTGVMNEDVTLNDLLKEKSTTEAGNKMLGKMEDSIKHFHHKFMEDVRDEEIKGDYNDEKKDGRLSYSKLSRTKDGRLDYSELSEKMVIKLNEAFDSNNQQVEALFYVLIGNTAENSLNPHNHISWKDTRRILYWGFANVKETLPWAKNPSPFIDKIQDIKKTNHYWRDSTVHKTKSSAKDESNLQKQEQSQELETDPIIETDTNK
ncbi:MAG: hypothetical protein AB1545_14795 [Thermodesulfobacteriota bacterium]